ncbi:hypothetical protein LIER_28091 [Lithospermum erythrorhizon]|uniref:NADP-dependent oxidoreductase domain-containing protein n=1 Tax=Lithospermum erythrorhizon TaxID=34254 RepID=A0AAV3RI99_LITER
MAQVQVPNVLLNSGKKMPMIEAIGEAIAIALHRDLIKSRDEVFITSKLWCTDAHPDLVLAALQDSLKRLNMSYVDLYLIHLPVRFKPETDIYKGFTKSDVLTFDIKGTWKAM